MATPNTKVGNLKDLERRIRRLERANPLSASSLGRGRMRFYDGSVLLIENGALNITGSATISGVLNVSGQTNLSGLASVTGPMNITGTTTIGGNTSITGELVVTGPTTLDGITDIGGDTTISGTLDIDGVTTVASNFEITTGGLFKSGVTQIEPTGKATFGSFVIDPSSNRLIEAPGGWLFSNGPDSLGLASSLTSSVNLNSDYAELNHPDAIVKAGNSGVELLATTSKISGTLLVGNGADFTGRVRMFSLATASSSYTPNVYIDANGRLWKTA